MLDQLKCLIEYQKIEDKKNQLIRSYEEAPRRIAELEKEFEHFRRTISFEKGRVRQCKENAPLDRAADRGPARAHGPAENPPGRGEDE